MLVYTPGSLALAQAMPQDTTPIKVPLPSCNKGGVKYFVLLREKNILCCLEKKYFRRFEKNILRRIEKKYFEYLSLRKIFYLVEHQWTARVSLTTVSSSLSKASAEESILEDGLPPVVAVKPLLAGLLTDDLHLDLLQLVRGPALAMSRPPPSYHCCSTVNKVCLGFR